MRMRLDSTTFGRRLAAIRADRRLTQEQLGVAVGKSKRTIRDWENSLFVELWLGDVAQCARALAARSRTCWHPSMSQYRPILYFGLGSGGAQCPVEDRCRPR
jgi:transcriptional regulator with XRE-family HTH domain